MKLFVFENGETDWFAANDEAEARRAYIKEYGLSERDMDGVKITEEENPSRVEVYPDDWDYDSEDDPPLAIEVMAKMTKPGIVCSTNY